MVANETGEQLPDPKSVGAGIVSAGLSTRMLGIGKTMVELGGVPLVARTVEVFEACDAVGIVVLVVQQNDLAAVAEL